MNYWNFLPPQGLLLPCNSMHLLTHIFGNTVTRLISKGIGGICAPTQLCNNQTETQAWSLPQLQQEKSLKNKTLLTLDAPQDDPAVLLMVEMQSNCLGNGGLGAQSSQVLLDKPQHWAIVLTLRGCHLNF